MDRLRGVARDVAWVACDNVHLTLKFLGGVDAARLTALSEALTAAVTGQPAFDLAVRGLGAFPSRTRARVLWAGVADGGPALASLAARVDDALEPLGFPREARAFSAHITLGRVREPRPNPRLAQALTSDAAFGRQRVGRVCLMRSELSPRGARYTELAAATLEARAPG